MVVVLVCRCHVMVARSILHKKMDGRHKTVDSKGRRRRRRRQGRRKGRCVQSANTVDRRTGMGGGWLCRTTFEPDALTNGANTHQANAWNGGKGARPRMHRHRGWSGGQRSVAGLMRMDGRDAIIVSASQWGTQRMGSKRIYIHTYIVSAHKHACTFTTPSPFIQQMKRHRRCERSLSLSIASE